MDISLLQSKTRALDVKYYTDPTYNNTRRVTLMLLDASITRVYGTNYILLNMIDDIERSIYANTCTMINQNPVIPSWDNNEFKLLYTLCRSNVTSIIQKGPHIVDQLISGDTTPDAIINIPLYELLPNMRNVWNTENDRKVQTVVVKVTTDYECPMCRERNATQNEVQTRGSDEALTLVFTCQSCSHVWTDD